MDNYYDQDPDVMQEKATKLATKMLEKAKGSHNLEIIYANMRIMTFLISQGFDNKENAYQFMAGLFDVGDELLKELEEDGFAKWSKK
jgi:ABC-type sugar transport system substrate-binding protein